MAENGSSIVLFLSLPTKICQFSGHQGGQGQCFVMSHSLSIVDDEDDDDDADDDDDDDDDNDNKDIITS